MKECLERRRKFEARVTVLMEWEIAFMWDVADDPRFLLCCTAVLGSGDVIGQKLLVAHLPGSGFCSTSTAT